MMTDLAAGARVVAVEHGRNGEPMPGGLRYPGTVEATGVAASGGLVAFVRYDDPSRHGSGLDPYDAGTGWRTWDGGWRWRIVPEAAG